MSRSTLPASGDRRTPGVSEVRSRINVGESIANDIRDSLPYGDRGEFDTLLKNLATYAVWADVVRAMAKCAEGSPGRTAVARHTQRGVDAICGEHVPPLPDAIKADDHAEFCGDVAIHEVLTVETPSTLQSAYNAVTLQVETLTKLARSLARRMQVAR